MSIRNSVSVHDYPRTEVLAAMRRMLDFLESNPGVDMPESMGELWVRTLARQNRDGLKTRDSVTEWLTRQLAILNPTPDEKFNDGDQFGASKDFGAGVRLTIFVSVGEVCEKTVETKIVQRAEEVSESTWHMPKALVMFGFNANQEKLREREREMGRFMRGAA